MAPQKDDVDKQRQWGRDDSYDEKNYEQFGSDGPYEGEEGAFPAEEYGELDEYGVEVDVEEADAITRELMEKNYPGLGDSNGNSGKPIPGLGGDMDAERKKAMKAIKGLAYLGCGEMALLSGIQGLLLGGVIGGVQTAFAGMSTGMLRQPGFGKFVWQQSKQQGKQFGMWLGAFTGMKCSLTFAREKNDIFNIIGSGFFAGSVSTLYTRNPTMIMMNGAGSAMIVSVLHLVGFGL
jgi:hypothetical protein